MASPCCLVTKQHLVSELGFWIFIFVFLIFKIRLENINENQIIQTEFLKMLFCCGRPDNLRSSYSVS